MPICPSPTRWFRRTTAHLLTFGLAACAGRGSAPVPLSDGEWTAYGRDAFSPRFLPLPQIDRATFSRLTHVWTFHTGEPLPTSNRKRSLEVTPLVADGVMYISTPLGKIIALDPVSGVERWRYDAHVDTAARFGDFTSRGVSRSEEHTPELQSPYVISYA